MHLEIRALPFEDMDNRKKTETSKDIRKRVIDARTLQRGRFGTNNGVRTNGNMSSKMVEKYCQVDKHGRSLLETSVGRLGLSARAYHRILKIARTIADLDFSENIKKQHLAEAIQYRRLG
jgi:magnesium chelatase family protein